MAVVIKRGYQRQRRQKKTGSRVIASVGPCVQGKIGNDVWSIKKISICPWCGGQCIYKIYFLTSIGGLRARTTPWFFGHFWKCSEVVDNYFWRLSKMAEKSRGRSCSEPFNCIDHTSFLVSPYTWRACRKLWFVRDTCQMMNVNIMDIDWFT